MYSVMMKMGRCLVQTPYNCTSFSWERFLREKQQTSPPSLALHTNEKGLERKGVGLEVEHQIRAHDNKLSFLLPTLNPKSAYYVRAGRDTEPKQNRK